MARMQRGEMEVQISQLFQRHEILKVESVLVQRFSLASERRSDFESLFGTLLAGAFLMPLERQDPAASPQIPQKGDGKVRRGDFGEALSKAIYDQVLDGYSAPGSKLWGKPNPDTSQTGEDRVALLTVSRSSKAEPVTIESKVRTTYNSPQVLLDLFNQPAEDRTMMRAAAWRNTVRDLTCAGAPDREFSYLMAKLMYERSALDAAEEPEYHLHGFLVVEPGRLSDRQIDERWGGVGAAPVSRLVVIEIDDLAFVVDACFDVAAGMQARDLAPHTDDLDLQGVGGIALGLSASISIDASDPPLLACPISQSALWFLADRDGLGAAARSDLTDSDDPYVHAFATLLNGRLPDPVGCDMEDLVETVRTAWFESGDDLHGEIAAISDAAEEWVERHPDHGDQMHLVAAALASRLARHPRRLLRHDASAGSHLDGLIDRLTSQGLVALWPPQARTVAAGLIAGGPQPFIVSMPTSGGKTLLIALSVAKALDGEADRQVVVLANTRALVRYLRRRLRHWLPSVETVALLGEIAHLGETCFPVDGPLSRIVVTTPERFDLDWRRAVTNDAGVLDPSLSTNLVVADEAHHISDLQRGARLEVGLSRARKAGIPVQMFSSQLGGIGDLEAWLGGAGSATSEWRPADVHRYAFFRSKDDKEGWVQAEGEEAEKCMTMPGGKIDHGDSSLAVRSRVSASAASGLGLAREEHGMVLVYTPQKRSVPSLAAEVRRRVLAVSQSWEPPSKLASIADRLPPAATEVKDLLRLGIGMHHASMSKFEHRAVEEAAELGLLRYIICTDTLLSGVDFPVRTVIATNCFRGQDLLSTAHLNNLAGRAGRGGRYMTGELVLMATDKGKAKAVLNKLAQTIPPTKSQLTKAFEVLRRVQDAVDVSDADARALRELDSFLLAAITEGAIEQRDLRMALEEALGSTLWWAGAPTTRRAELVELAVRRGGALAAAPAGWNRAVYRTGLDAGTCAAVKTFVEGLDQDPLRELAEDDLAFQADDLLEVVSMIATLVQPGGGRWPDDLADEAARRKVLNAWLTGSEGADEFSTGAVEKAFGALASHGTWIVGSALEILGWKLSLSSDQVATLAARLELPRLRTGTPSEGAAHLVDGGLPREDAAELWRSYIETTTGDFIQFAKDTLSADVVELIEWPVGDGA